MIKGSRAWVKFLDTIELPVLARTIKAILKVTADDETSLAQLTEVVLRDADLTSGIIKLANTTVYNPSGTQIKTISRAVVQIGFESVQSIAISSALVDKLTKYSNRHRLFHCLVRSFTAAVHARYMAMHLDTEVREEIFVAALLCDVGEAAFWASTHVQTAELDRRLTQAPNDAVACQRDTLGTTFKAISKGLVDSWNLGELVKESIDAPVSIKAKIVRLSLQIAHLDGFGLKNGDIEQLAERVSQLNGKDTPRILADLKENARKSAVLASRLGIKNAHQYLSDTRPAKQKRKQNSDSILQSLIALSSACGKGEGFNVIAQIVLSCVQSGINLDRAGLFMAKPGSNKFCLTHYKYAPDNTLQLPQLMELDDQHPLSSLLIFEHVPRAFLTRLPKDLVVRQPLLHNRNEQTMALVAPIHKKSAVCGFLYADITGYENISQEQVDSVQMVVQQLVLNIATMRRVVEQPVGVRFA